MVRYKHFISTGIALTICLFFSLSPSYAASAAGGDYPCDCNGGGTCYDIYTEADFDQVPWVSTFNDQGEAVSGLSAGDTVRIHYKETPYRKIIGLNNKGTAEQPITICGVKGPNGELPTISGQNATPVNGYLYGWGSSNIGDYGLILIGRSATAGDSWLHKAEHITIKNLKIEGAHASNSYTIPGTTPRSYVYGAAGIRVTNGNNISIIGCEITGNGNGIFLRGDDNSEDATITRNTLVEGNYIYENGNAGRNTEHNIYSQGVDPIFQYNRIGRMRPGAPGTEPAGGVSLKDRSSGTIIRYNWIESGARTLDLVEAEDASYVVDEPSYGNAYVYGNILINEIDDDDDYVSSLRIVHFGADNFADDSNGTCTASDPDICRTGTLYFYNNTVIVKDYRNIAQGSDWVQDRMFEISIADATVDIRNNIFHLYAPNGYPNLTLMDHHGTANLNGTNWITSGWVEHIMENEWHQWTGTINYNGTLIEGADPGFVNIGGISGDLSADDYKLVENSQAIDQSTALASQVINAGYSTNEMYQLHQYGTARAASGSAMDLGAFEYQAGPVDELPGDVNLDGTVNILDATACVNFILGTSELNGQAYNNADMNNDTVIDILDIVSIVNKILEI